MKHVSSKRILIVEDDSLLRDMLFDVLKKYGYQVNACQDGIEALAMVSDRNFDLIVTDLKMPNLDGNELYLSIVQKYPDMKDKFLFISGNFNDLIFKKAAKGEKRYLAKPFKVTELLAHVNAILKEFVDRDINAIDKQLNDRQSAENVKNT